MLYSVGENGVDDGGHVPYDGAPEQRGDLSAVAVRPPESLRGVSRAAHVDAVSLMSRFVKMTP